MHNFGIHVFIVHNIVELWECIDYVIKCLAGETPPSLPSQEKYMQQVKSKSPKIKDEQPPWEDLSGYTKRRK